MRVFVSPPFARFVPPVLGLVPIHGTFTLDHRPGLWAQVARTLRPSPCGGWYNAIGLRNPGLRNLQTFPDHVSVAVMHPGEVDQIERLLPASVDVEQNLSCPNAAAADALLRGGEVRCKLAPGSMGAVRELWARGVRRFHVSNTLPVAGRGGLSGPSLVQANLRQIWEMRRAYGRDAEIVGGGGIYDAETAQAYLRAGADHVSLATVCLRPTALARLLAALRRETI